MYYIDMPVVIVAMYELLNLAKVKSAVSQIEFYVDRQFIKKISERERNFIKYYTIKRVERLDGKYTYISWK